MTKTATNNTDQYDVIIVGGGMVGASLAIALAPLQLKVVVVDAFLPNSSDQPSYDDRSIALSYGSSLIFKGMGLWDELKKQTSPIKQIHVSDRGYFGASRLNAEQEKVDALGYLIESRTLGKQLYQQLDKSDVELMIPAKVVGVQKQDESSIQINVLKGDEQFQLKTRLLVAADGAQSPTRELSGVSVSKRDYQQSAIIANVSTQKPHNGQAFERFTNQGPIALLPLSGNRSSLVWTHSTKNGSDDCDRTMALKGADFLHELGIAFGYRLGKFTKVGARSIYPLSLVTADKNTAYRTVVFGNASHTLHPVAGQGLNLSLRDVAVLADLLAELYLQNTQRNVKENTRSPSRRLVQSIAELLVVYEEQRDADLKNTVKYTDSLVRLFSNDIALLGHARAGGLLAVDRISPLRKWLTRQSMGVNHRQARLSRGLALRVSQ